MFRISDCSQFCIFDMKDFLFVSGSTDPMDGYLQPPIRGIIDKRTQKLYPPTAKALLHLGATQVNLFEEDVIFDEEERMEKI